MIGYPETARPHIKRHHIDGPVLCLRDGRMHWLTLWERVLLALNKTDALTLERKHWGGAQRLRPADRARDGAGNNAALLAVELR